MNEAVELSYGQVFGFLRRGLLAAVVLGLVVAAGLFWYARHRGPSFEAQAVLVVNPSSIDFRGLGLPDVSPSSLNVEAYGVAATSNGVITNALASLGQPTTPAAAESLRHHMKVRTAATSELIYIAVTSATPAVAANESNAVAKALMDWDRSRSLGEIDRVTALLKQRISVQQNLIAKLQKTGGAQAATELGTQVALLGQEQGQIDGLKALRTDAVGSLALLQAATLPTSGLGHKPTTFGLLGLFLGVLLAYGLTFLLELVDTRIYTVEGVERVTKLPALAAIPRFRRKRTLAADRAALLRTNLTAALHGQPPNVIQVTSARYGHDSASAAMALAESFAIQGTKTLLVDADMQRPVIGRRYGLGRAPHLTLSACLRNQQGTSKPHTLTVGGLYRLSVLYEPRRVPDGANLLTRSYTRCVSTWEIDYEVIVVHMGPVDRASETPVAAAASDATLLAVRPARAKLWETVQATKALQRAGARLVGCVVTGAAGRLARSQMVVEPQSPASTDPAPTVTPPQPTQQPPS